MNEIRIQDDLYNYVNKAKIDELVIPDDMPMSGGFATIAIDVEKLMINEFEQMCKNGEYPNEYLRRACLVYKACKNVKKREKLGITPVVKILAKLLKLETVNDFNKAFNDLLLNNVKLPFSISVDTDMMDTKHHCVAISGPSVILPDVTFYSDEMKPQRDALLGVYANMVKQILAKTELTEDEQNKFISDTFEFDALLAKYVKSNEEWSEYVKTYNPMKTSKAQSLVKPVNLKKQLKALFGFIPEKVICAEPRYFKAFKEVFNEDTFELYKHWAYVTSIVDSCNVLSEELREIGSTYRRALNGVAQIAPLDKFAYQIASSLVSEPVGLYYGEKYFGQEAKKDVVEIVNLIIEKYKERISKNDILEESTKQKAILKLSTMGVKMGYPDKVDPIYDKFVFNESASLFNIVMELNKIRLLDSFSKLTKDVDPTTWAMPGHMVNACYNPFVNDITFPAAILQPPFYSINQTRSENLGGIGAVIGHEISHAFDSNGAKFDENGNLSNWWTKEDLKKFNKKINAMIKQFDGIELPWGTVNGKFAVSENIADNGGVAVTLDIMSNMENASFEEYFINWAKIWCVKARPEFLQLLLSVDVHGPNILRANIPPRNFEKWYETFNVKKTDKMYIAPSKRVVIW